MRIALYVGSFDPITLGHLDIIRQAQVVFDHVHVGIGVNPRKAPMFDSAERRQMINHSLTEVGADLRRVSVGIYTGSMMEEARMRRATAIVRGLRQISDFGDEFTINGMVTHALPEVPMAYFICRQDFLHVSSSSVKEMAALGEDISWMVAPNAVKTITDKVLTFK